MKEQKEEEKAPLLNSEGDPSLGCDVNMDRVVETKKRDTSFVDARKVMIEKYGSYYSVELDNAGIVEWCDKEYARLNEFLGNLVSLKNESMNKIKSEKQAKISEFMSTLGADELEQLKSMIK